MAVVGQATVVVRALANTFREDLRREFSGAEKDADASGSRAGGRFGRRFSETVSNDTGAIDLSGLARRFERAGDDSGQSFMSRLSGRLRGIDNAAENGLRNLRTRFGRAGDDSGGSFISNLARRLRIGTRDVENQVDDMGNNLSRNLSAIKIDLPDIGGGFAAKLLAIIPLVGVLGGGLAALVGSLTAVAAAAAYAAGALAIVTTGVAALAAGLVTGFLAFGGIIKAVQALSAQQKQGKAGAASYAKSQQAAADAVVSAQEHVADATQQVKNAEYALADARKSASEDAVRDAHSVADAEYGLAQAQRAEEDAQKALTQARVDARSKLQDLQLQLRGAVLSEEEASLRLQQAQQDYQDTLNNPSATAIDAEQARLNLQEAELSLDEAKKRRQDVTKETEDANKRGVKGSTEVVAARQHEHDTTHSLSEAEYALKQARQQAADDAVRDAHSVAQAQLSVARAERELKDAVHALVEAQQNAAAGGGAAATAANNVKKAMAGLTPEGRKFARFLFGLRPELEKLKRAAGARLFLPLELDLTRIVSTFLPALRHAVRITGQGLADFFGSITDAITSGGFIDNFTKLANAFSRARDGGSDFAIIGRILGNLLRGLLGLARAAEPVFRRFLVWVDRFTGAFAGNFEGTKNVNRMADAIGRMGDVAAKFGHVAGGLFTLIGNVFRAARPSGVSTVGGWADDLDRLNAALAGNSPKFQALQRFFEKVKEPAAATAHFLGALVKQFLLLGQNGDLTNIFNSLTDAMPTLRHAIETFTNKVAPAMIHILRQLLDIFNRLANSTAFTIFVAIVKGAIDVISGFVAVLQWGPIGKFTSALVGLGAAYIALKKLGKVTGVKALVQSLQVGAAPAGTARATKATGLGSFIQGARGNPIVNAETGKVRLSSRLGGKLTGQVRPTTDLRLASEEAVTGTRKAFSSRAGRVGLVAAGAVAAGAIAAGIVHSHSIGDAAKNIGSTIKDNLVTILALAGPQIFSGISRAAKTLGPLLGNLLGKINLVAAAQKAWTGIAAAFNLVMDANPVILIGAAIVALIAGLVILYKKWKPFRDVVNAVGKALKAVGELIVKVVVKAFDFLKKHLQLLLLAFGPLGIAIFEIIEIFKHWDEIKKIVGKILDAVVGFFKALPGRIWALAGALGQKVEDLAGKVKTFFTDKVGGFIDSVVNFFKALPGRIWDLAGQLHDKVAALADKVKTGFTDKVSGFVDAVVGFFRDLPGKLLAFAGDLHDKAAALGQKIYDGVVSKVKAIPGAILGFIKSLPSKIGSISSTLLTFGEKIGHLLLQGLRAMLGDGVGFITHIAKVIGDAIVNWVKDHLNPFGSGHAPHNPAGSIPGAPNPGSFGPDPNPAALGGTFRPRRGGTRVTLAEAGRSETVVDTASLNRQIYQSAQNQESVVAELRKLRAAFERSGGINVEELNVQAAPGERAAESVPRALRVLQFELGA